MLITGGDYPIVEPMKDWRGWIQKRVKTETPTDASPRGGGSSIANFSNERTRSMRWTRNQSLHCFLYLLAVKILDQHDFVPLLVVDEFIH